MTQLTLLRAALCPHLPWHGARLSLIAAFLIAVFRVKSVNLSELATGFSGQAQRASNYKRLQRFLREYELDYVAWVKLIIAWMSDAHPGQLSLDRTQWHYGQQVINILIPFKQYP
jgi:hypothetical protein